MVATDASRSAFVKSVTDFVEQYNYDGVMLQLAGKIYSDQDLIALLEKFHEDKFTSRYTLAISVPVRGGTADNETYDGDKIAK